MPELRPAVRQTIGIAAGLLVILWRILVVTPSELWRDWALLLAVFQVVLCFRRESGSTSSLTAATMAFLLGLYLAGQAPHVLAMLGLAS